ncbi:MAG: glycosyltransferase family 2 protein [Chitinispirillaceae bacterium]|nr:glycosyltransferase family 2 protein [Chitinispirillaceae bacterium]
MSISIFIPAYNASRHIENVIIRIPAALSGSLHRIYIVNDGSTDETSAVINKLSMHNNRICAIHFEHNKGYGCAVREGLRLCCADGCDYAVCLHADEQYPPEVVIDFIETMKSGKIDLLQGSRIASGTALSGGMPLYKFIAGKILTTLENLVLGLGLTDYHSGMLFYSRKTLNKIRFDKLSTSFDFDLEVIAALRTAGLRVSELPIPTRYASEKSYLNPLTYGLRVLRVLFRYMLGYYSKCII